MPHRGCVVLVLLMVGALASRVPEPGVVDLEQLPGSNPLIGKMKSLSGFLPVNETEGSYLYVVLSGRGECYSSVMQVFLVF